MLGSLIDRLSSLGLVKKRWSRRDVLRVFEEMEIDLLSRGFPPSVLEMVKDVLSSEMEGLETKGDPRSVVKDVFRRSLLKLVPTPIELSDLSGGKSLFKVIFFGFNGVGKSLSIVKLAKYLQSAGGRVLVVSADTYRAAAGEQLEGYCRSAGVNLFKGRRGADPAAVCFDALGMASARGYTHLLIDTAGRNYLSRNLIDELRKVVRVVEPDLRVLVLDGVAGNDILNQCDSFGEVGFDAIVVTKVDAGGLVAPLFASIHSRKPVLFLGSGQGLSDISPFDPSRAVEVILG
ncbi:MAG: signal recognition particle-docking protein FtsY [Candidatus Korarchaeota archaeon NZ13-K]|nr:MAG: signal recognition particle-docking protein FtsY [Candidatus Korarchaeota archaeon NZ13-K]